MRFAEAYGVRHKGYCHLVVATIAVVMFGGMCRYDDVSRLLWRTVRFLENRSGFEFRNHFREVQGYAVPAREQVWPERLRFRGCQC